MRRAAALAAGGAALVGLLASGGVPCLFAHLFHVPCPGCGSTRAVLALLRGDPGAALHANPAGPVAAVLAAACGLQAIASMLDHGDLRGVGAGRLGAVLKRLLLVTAIVEVVVWIARFFGALGGPVSV